jgi:hypothetical protein
VTRTASADTPAPAPANSDAAFPPATIEAFLRFCAGEWMSLRSRFALEDSENAAPALTSAAAEGASPGDGDEWHTSERGELVVTYLESASSDSPGGLSVGPKGTAPQHLLFAGDGSFEASGRRGRWELWPDGSLELVLQEQGRELRERIWFTKPNLRLRSTVENRADGQPGRASFSSEIRRVSRPNP